MRSFVLMYMCAYVRTHIRTYMHIYCTQLLTVSHGKNCNFYDTFQEHLSMVEDLLDKLNELETNFTAVDEVVPMISSATRVSQIIQMYVHM